MTTDRDALIAQMFPEPIAAYVDALTSPAEVPVVAVAACLTRYQEAGPLLREILTRAADENVSAAGDNDQVFRTLHIVGGARDALAFPAVLRLLQGPAQEVEWLLGDAATETLPSIIVGVFDGNEEALFGAIANRQAPDTVRGTLLRAASFLTHEKRIDRGRMIACLEQFARVEPTPGDELAWFDWSEAIAQLGLRHLEPLVSQAETSGWLDETIFERDAFEKLLARAEQEPDDGTRFKENNVGYLDDVPGALQRFGYEDEDDGWGSEQDSDDEEPPQPFINPWRHVGRNDPCPCGSGKKAKRCCLAA